MRVYRSVFVFMAAGPINSASITHYLLFLVSSSRLLRYQEMSNATFENYRSCVLYSRGLRNQHYSSYHRVTSKCAPISLTPASLNEAL